MRAWPLAFEYDNTLRAAFIDACECLVIYQVAREEWKPKIDKISADFVWSEAKRLLNL